MERKGRTMSRKDAERKRARAIRMMRDAGMTDAEIEAALGKRADRDTPAKMESVVNEHDSTFVADSEGIIDAEIVDEQGDPCSDTPMTRAETSEAHLPAVIPAKPTDSSDGNEAKFSQYSEIWWQHAKPQVQQRRCKAHRKNGDQCKQPAINGATVCRFHGGAAKHVKMAARARLENATDLMAKQLLGMAIDPNVADAVKLSAIKDALDRGGLKAPNEVVLSPGQQSGFDDIFTDIVYSAPAQSEPIETQDNSTRFFNAPNTASVDADEYAQHPEQTTAHGDSDRPAPPQRHEPPERRQSRRESSQNRYDALSDEDAMRLVYEENARNAADPPPPRPMRALPPGRSGW